MEILEFDYPAHTKANGRGCVGVVGSGDLEVLLEPANTVCSRVRVRTSVQGFATTWKAVLDRFFSHHDEAVYIEINDAGATPGTVTLRLEQALEASRR